jgi:hypothetical protein
MNTPTKKFTVNIEQPLCKSFEIEAEDMEQAEEIARAKYASGEFVLTNDDLGTDALFQVGDEETGEWTEWN